MSSRLEKNLITVVTGQAVDAFDKLFRTLYGNSRSVDLRQVAKEPEPEPEPLPQPALVAPPSAAVARKLYNPKYALALGNPSTSPTPTPSAEQNSPKKTQNQKNSENPEVPETKKRRRRRASKEAVQEEPPIHPGLANLEKACLMSYLPTWPEPDPASDVIGFINIRDANKPIQVHLQRSEMYGTSQAIKFSSPFSIPKETLSEVATPRQLSAKHEEMDKPQRTQIKTKENEGKVQPTQVTAPPGDVKSKAAEPNSPAPGPKSDKDTAKTLNTKDKLHSNTPTNQDKPHLNACTPPQSSSKASSPNTGRPSHTTQAVTTNNPNPEPLPGKAEKEASLTRKVAVVFRTDRLESNRTQSSPLHGSTDSNTGQYPQTEMMLPHTDSHTPAVHIQPQNSAEISPSMQTTTTSNHMPPSSISQSVSSTSLSENNKVSTTTSTTTSIFAPLSSNSSSTALNPHLPSSSGFSTPTSTPPIPKPRTIQLVIEDAISSDSQKLPELNPGRSPETSTRLVGVHNEPAVAMVQTSPEKEPETITELHNNSGDKTQKDSEHTGNIREAPQQKQRGTFQETKNEEVVGVHDERAGTEVDIESQSDVLITEAQKAESVSIQEIIPKDDEPKTLTSIDCKLNPQKDCEATVQAGTKAPEKVLTGSEFAEVPNEHCENVTQHKTYHVSALELQTISYYSLTPQDIDVSDSEDSVKAPTHPPVAATHTTKDSAGDGTHTSAADTDGKQANPDTTKHNTHSTFQEQVPKAQGNVSTPEKSSLRLPLSDMHKPDLGSSMPEKESRSLTALARTPTPDGFLPRTPTPDSRTHTPDSHSYTPDFRTPSDGYVSPRPDSALSTTSEEYYECSDFSLHELDRAAHRNHGATEDHVSFTRTNTSNVETVAANPTSINYNACAATLGTTDRNTSSKEKESLSGPAGVSSSSSLPEKNVKKEEETANEENGRQVDEKDRKLSVSERTEGDSKGTERRGNEEAKRTTDHFVQGKDLTETVEKNKEAQPVAPKRKRVLNQSAAETLVDGGVTPGKVTNEGAEPKRLSTGDVKANKVSSEKAVDTASVGPHQTGQSSVERKGRPQSTTETEGQKLLHTPPRPARGQQQNSGSSSPSRTSRPARPLSASQPLADRSWVSRQLSQPDSKVLHGSFQVLDNTSSPRRPPSRPPPPATAGAVGSAVGRKQAEVSHSFLSRQPLAAQARARAGQSLNQHPYTKPQTSFLHTQSTVLPHPHSQNQTVSAHVAHHQEEGKSPFSFTFSRLYSLKGLKDKMSKLPAQTKGGSTSSPVQGHKSTS